MKILEDVGNGATGFLEYAGGLANLSAESGTFVGRMRIRLAETFSQAFTLGVQSTSIVLLTSLFTGMVISLESAVQAVQFGVGDLVGGGVAFISARELGPMLSAVVVAGRTGAAIAAELGSMVVTEQVEAIEALGLSPVQMLVVPRLLALMVMLPILTVFADIVSVLGGMWLAQTVAHISHDVFIQSARQAVSLLDVVKGLSKAVVFGAIIALVGSYQGLGTRGGAAGVGRATTGAVVISIILIFITNFVMSFLLYGYSG
ncbi:MAG: ABC transporter permease [Candidatus Baltobacteraceae bacterium]|jgi:phospholipid/cholesterol/gamma-HCH transport system permease protein